jgi:hypothetical protein
MNPADQERKVARKRELKKNRKQRVMVRSAMLKSKDPDDIIDQLRKLDQVGRCFAFLISTSVQNLMSQSSRH